MDLPQGFSFHFGNLSLSMKFSAESLLQRSPSPDRALDKKMNCGNVVHVLMVMFMNVFCSRLCICKKMWKGKQPCACSIVGMSPSEAKLLLSSIYKMEPLF